MDLGKRLRQLTAVLTHPGSLASKYDTPWDNILYRDTRERYNQNRIQSCLLHSLRQCFNLAIPAEPPDLVRIDDSGRWAGSISPYELTALTAICRAVQPDHILEIGTFEGRTTLNLARNCPQATVHTLCLHPDQCGIDVGKYFRGTPESVRINQIFADSRSYNFSQLPAMDIIFIDGDHSYEAVVSDTRNALSILKPGGFVLWHDIDRCHLATTHAVLTEIERNGLDYRCIDGTSIAIARKTA